MRESKKLPSKIVNAYALSNGIASIASTVPSLFLTMFMTDYLGISPVAIGTGMLIAKGLDFVLCLVAGVIVEKVHMRHGKYLSWLRVLTVTLFFGNIMQVLDTTHLFASPTVRLLFCMLFYLIFHGSMNFNSLARAGMITKLAQDNMEDRNRLSARKGQISAAVSILSSAICLPCVQLVQEITNSETLGYFLVALLFSSVYVLSNLYFLRLAAPYDPPEDGAAGRASPPIGAIFRSVATNRQMLVLFLAITLAEIGMQLYLGIIVYMFRVKDIFSFYSAVLTARAVGSFLVSLVAPAIGRRIGKKKSLMLDYGISAFAGVLLWLFALQSDGRPNLFILTAAVCLKGVAEQFYEVYQANYWIDCGEYGYYKTGVDNRTMAMSVMNWPMKLAYALGGSLSSFGLAWAGYVKPAGDALPTFTHMNRYLLVVGLFPSAVMVLAVVIIGRFYKLDDAQAERYARANLASEQAGPDAKIPS